MRFNLEQKLFVVAFDYPELVGKRKFLTYRQPMLYDDIFPTKCFFKELTVKEHHKVRSEWQEETEEATCDGFILADKEGNRFHNQYPTASYGQVTDTADRRFNLDIQHKGMPFAEYVEKHPDTVYDYHLLSDLLVEIQRGLPLLKEHNSERSNEKAQLLEQLYKQITEDFTQTFDSKYSILLEHKPLFDDSKLILPCISFVKTAGVATV
jgi:hypothetical protein